MAAAARSSTSRRGLRNWVRRRVCRLCGVEGGIGYVSVGLAREVAREGIRVNGVRAGIIETEIHTSGGEPGRVARLGPQQPMGRGGEAVEVARAIVWLLSDEASYTTGSFIDVAGGR